MKKGNIVSAIIVILLGIYVFAATRNYPSFGGDVPGPSFFPRIIAGVLIGLGIILIISTIINKKEYEKIELFNKDSIKIYISMLILLIYLVLFRKIGFLILTPIVLFILIKFYGIKSYLKNAIISIVFTMVIYCVFEMLLTVPLPEGILNI